MTLRVCSGCSAVRSSGGAVYANEFDLEANAISVLEKNLSENELFYSAPPSVSICFC